ncbi:hypothetical protein ACFO8O_02170 [Hephaestia sp. GCM10023244]|uniref:hypothetical protein n=1 Tax=unclassified Hephaestia TaxID=2631281 RepID=UPI0020779846|nr:hypothetical protein [Hephaestia sp. MAHUQ-44]MCM8729778.1 hypothetical protein [Hephaestia sp. MAHUQ-44]
MNAAATQDWAHRLKNFPARSALRLANAPPVSRVLANRYRRALAAHRAALPVLSGLDREIVTGLERDGIFVTSLDVLGLPGSQEALRAGQRLADAFAEEARQQVAAGKTFTIVPPGNIANTPEIVMWGLHDRLLDIVEAYIGLPVAYDGVNIIYTVADGREAGTRQWHRDWEDRKTIKVAIYCNDVGKQDGPFQAIARADPAQDDARGYHYTTATSAELATVLGADFERDIVTCDGPAGTVIFVDTAKCFHRGQPAFATDRRAIFHSYFARTPRHPFLCERSGMTRGQLSRLARGLNPRQQSTILWRRSLPALVRLIPPATL